MWPYKTALEISLENIYFNLKDFRFLKISGIALVLHKLHQISCTGGGKGGAMGLQPHLILWVLHRILFFTIEIFFSVWH